MDLSLEISDTMHFLFLSSLDASQHHPDNTPEDFTVTLPKPYDLRGNGNVPCWRLPCLRPRTESCTCVAI